MALGPLGVLPDLQGTGIGSALVHATLAAADALGQRGVVLLGHPTYYPRFGFGPAVDHGITPPQDWGPAYFMLRPLGAWGDGLAGAFRYAPAFERLERLGLAVAPGRSRASTSSRSVRSRACSGDSSASGVRASRA